MAFPGEVVDADVLVIGGGGAACRAAVEADESGAEVLMVVKGVLGEGGSTAHRVSDLSGFQAAIGHADPADTPEAHFRDIVDAARGVCDEGLARIVAREAPRRLLDLERLGVDFERAGRRYAQSLGCFSSRPRMLILRGSHGQPIVSALKGAIRKRGIEVRERTMATRLLTRGGRCVGATGVDEEGNLLVFRARSTVLATGGAGQLFRLSLVPPDVTGDGYAMALRAGAELVNMEFLQVGFGVPRPEGNLLLNPYGVWSLHPELYNSEGERFLQRCLPGGVSLERCLDLRALHWPFTTSDESMHIDIAVQGEILAGRGTERGGVYADFTGIPREAIAEKAGSAFRWLLSQGVDLSRRPTEVSLFAHCTNGGLRINGRAETTVPGLYAAGEVTGGPHGADRLGGNMLATCQVFGAIAGESAAEGSKTTGKPAIDGDQVDEEYHRVHEILRKRAGEPAHRARRRIQEVMWRNVLVIRNGGGLEGCIRELKQMEKHHLPKIGAESGRGLFEALEVRNLLDAGRIIATAASLRAESRGGHYREDFPRRDDRHWRRSIILRQERGEIKPRLAKL